MTICTNKKKSFFAHFEDDGVVLSRIGRVADLFLVDIPKHAPDVTIDQHVIMPNHVHAIIVIDSVGAAYMPPAKPRIETTAPSNPGTLSVVVQMYKSAVTRWSRQNGYSGFAWQRGFYEHVIRNEDDLKETRYYIENNPLKWIDDDHYTV